MTATEVAYPTDAWHRFHERGVWPLGDDADEGVMVEGGDYRSRAALIQYLVRERGESTLAAALTANGAEVLRVRRFHYECGCTSAEHDAHVEAECSDDYTGSGDECGEACRHHGLPPCEPDRFTWSPDYMPDDEPGGLPVLYLLWG